MSVYSAEYHAMIASPGPAGVRPASLSAQSVTPDLSSPASAADTKPHEGFFHHLWDVINPLQHIPVIGTVYRAITGEHLDPVEKIAGDTLYGGVWGAITSVADVAFEGLTGKSFEDTALSLFKTDKAARLASVKVTAPSITPDISLSSADFPALPSPMAVSANAPGGVDVAALSNALSAKGVDSDTASRALYAYRRSMGMNASLSAFASVH